MKRKFRTGPKVTLGKRVIYAAGIMLSLAFFMQGFYNFDYIEGEPYLYWAVFGAAPLTAVATILHWIGAERKGKK